MIGDEQDVSRCIGVIGHDTGMSVAIDRRASVADPDIHT